MRERSSRDLEFGPLRPIHAAKPKAEPMRLNLSSLILIVLIGAGVFFVTAPWFAFRSLRDAAKTNDVPALAELIDYKAVRQSLAAQLSGEPPPQTPPPDIWRDPVGALKNALTPTAPAPPEVERYMTPKGLANLANGRPYNSALPADRREPFPKIAYWGPDRCRIVVSDPVTPSRKTEFTFQRRGIFNWKVVRIVLPGKAGAPASKPARKTAP